MTGTTKLPGLKRFKTCRVYWKPPFEMCWFYMGSAQIALDLLPPLSNGKTWKKVLQAILASPYTRVQQEFLIPGILDKSQLHFFSLGHEKRFSLVSFPSRNTRIKICNLVLVSKYDNGLIIISISSRQERARKIIRDLVSKNCTFS